MEEILKQIQEKGLTIELWDSIEDIGIKFNIISDYDISNIYWHIVNTDPEILKRGNKIYKERQEIKETKDKLERLITSNAKSIDLWRLWSDITYSYNPIERIEYAKRLIDSGKDIRIDDSMLTILSLQDKEFLQQITEYKIEKKQILSKDEGLRIIKRGNVEEITRMLDCGMNMIRMDMQTVNEILERRESSNSSDKIEYTQQLKDKLFENFIKNRSDENALLINHEVIENFNIEVIEKMILEGINVPDRYIISSAYNVSIEDKKYLLRLKLKEKLPLSSDGIAYCALLGMDAQDVARKHIQNNGQITPHILQYIYDEDERMKLLLEHADKISNIESIITPERGMSDEKKEIYKAYISNAKNMDSKIFYKYFSTLSSIGIIDLVDREEKHRIISSYLKNIDSETEFEVQNILDLFHMGEVEDKEQIILQCIQLDLPIKDDHLDLIQSPDQRYEAIKKDLDKGLTTYRLSPGKLEYMSRQQKYEILNKAIENGYVVDDDFWDCYESDEERENAIKEYVTQKRSFDIGENIETISKISSEEEMLNLIKATILNGKNFEMYKFRKSIRRLSDEQIIELITFKEEYEEEYSKSITEYNYVRDIDKQINAKIEFLERKGRHEVVEVGKDLVSVIQKYTENINSKQNKQYREVLEERLSYLKKLVASSIELTEFQDIQEIEESHKRIKEWEKRNIIPEQLIFDKVPAEKIEEFDYKIWNNLVKGVNKDLKDEEKGALVEIAYVFGLFNKDLKVARGIAKKDEEMTDEEKIQKSAWENYEARKTNVIKFINSLESTDILHQIFDGMGMEFNPKFYHFFMLNKKDIIDNIELVEDRSQLEGIRVDKIQNELKVIYRYIDKIEDEYRTGTPTIKQCTNYLIQLRKDIANRKYENMKEGNSYLARLCALSGCSQTNFEKYQDLFEKSKSRLGSSIPRIKAEKKIEIIEEDEFKKVTVEKNKKGNDQLKIETSDKKISFEILRMDDPRATVCGEKIFSDCCQSIGGAGESCLKHSQESKNGGILEIKAEDGTFLGQSWCWVNGNVLCFDSAELKGLDQNKNMSDKEKEEYLSMIKIGYEQMAKRMLEESNKKVEEYINQQKAKAVLEYGKDSYEYKKREEEIEKVADNIRIKQVTIGHGYWDISKKLSNLFEEDKKTKIITREDEQAPTPIENVSYINDSRIQYELARIEGIGDREIKTDMTIEEQQHLYKDNRSITKQSGQIDRDVLAKVKHIEQITHNEESQIMKDINVAYNTKIEEKLARLYSVNKDDLNIVCGEDWYLIYSKNDDNIIVHDIAKAKESRIEGEEAISNEELRKAFYEIMEDATKHDKTIKLQIRKDEEYDLYQQLIENEHIKSTGKQIETQIYLDNFETIDFKQIEYTVTQKGKKAIEDLKKDEDIEL